MLPQARRANLAIDVIKLKVSHCYFFYLKSERNFIEYGNFLKNVSELKVRMLHVQTQCKTKTKKRPI